MKSRDVIQVFDTATVGTRVEVVNTPLMRALKSTAAETRSPNPAS